MQDSDPVLMMLPLQLKGEANVEWPRSKASFVLGSQKGANVFQERPWPKDNGFPLGEKMFRQKRVTLA